MTSGCLDGVRVLELARFQAGPRGGMLMSDLGAEVIKIEVPKVGDNSRGSTVLPGARTWTQRSMPATKAS